ncbi:ACP S-malonyltransferase [Cytobacillus sp. IB215316]|uniref:ACP S-malonyltransferase n=1 Tax=Cytobacillus sp. IB215316 TaxID=3097354 RepID=UPI002A0C6043|nr:ACP S-malonyltransferase [Cytobacillus sp. IB215316]MDX8362287.1 ACP S-malonyltransferase [Cytobacillus sp. IB215316]
MGKIAFVFPGQGSQIVGMGQSLAQKYDNVAAVFNKADEKLGLSLTDLIFQGPADKLTLTMNAQPALLTTSIAILERFKEENIRPDYVAGHSLGEYSALVAAEAMSFEDAVYAVRKRGELMEEAVPAGEGSMAAVLGMDQGQLQEITTQITADGYPVQLANLNCPGQIVISGTAEGVSIATKQCKEHSAKRVIPLVVSGPFHSSLMQPAANKFDHILNEITINHAKVPVVANIHATPLTKSTDIKQALIEQLYSPVLWQQSVEYMLDNGVDTFIEIGPGKVLSGLIKKVNRRVNAYSINDEESMLLTIERLKGE